MEQQQKISETKYMQFQHTPKKIKFEEEEDYNAVGAYQNNNTKNFLQNQFHDKKSN